MESIVQKDKWCFLCGTTRNLECHHIYAGSKRKASERLGLKVWLCSDCHTQAPDAVHRKHTVDMYLKQTAQRIFEETHTREEFIKEIGKSYL